MTEAKNCSWVVTAEIPEGGDIRSVVRQGIKIMEGVGIVDVEVRIFCGPLASDPFGDRDKLVFTKSAQACSPVK